MAARLACLCANDYGEKKALAFQSSVRKNFRMENSNSINAGTLRALCSSKTQAPRSAFRAAATYCEQ